MIGYVANLRAGADAQATPFGAKQAERARRFHQGLPAYRPTELLDLRGLAETLGLASLHVKDESSRFGLNAFKVLGGSYCVGHALAEMAGLRDGELTYERLTRPDVREVAREVTFVTATDGNHGRGVAWAARELGARAVVYLPRGSSAERVESIRVLGAEASVTELSYDDAVRLAARRAQERGWVLLQDTSWEGYTKVPTMIMQGYLTMAAEAVEQLGSVTPTHVFLQAGVGAMAGALAAFLADYYGIRRPTVTIVEPDGAGCLYRTALANDGRLHAVRELDTIMAGLCCGEPCGVGWEMLSRYEDCFVTVPDWVAAKGMRVLANPVGNDARVVSGESGAVTVGLVAELMTSEGLAELRETLGIGRGSHVLCISTEGDTDRDSYRRIVWDGAYPSERRKIGSQD